MSDDGFHEIQLNGKQLIFLFMAATVVSVVIFLCGVMVGRGVRSGRGETTPSAELETPAQAAPAPDRSRARASIERGVEGAGQPADAADARRRHVGLQGPDGRQAEGHRARDAGEGTGQARRDCACARAAEGCRDREGRGGGEGRAEARAARSVDKDKPAAVTSGGYAVQLTALRDRSEADAIVKRLAGKGYPAYVVNPLPGKPPVYRVQVGRYQNRADADRIASKLQKEEQFSPWVTR